MRSENNRLEMRQKEKFKMAKTTIKKKKVPGVSTIVADILAQEDQAIDLVSLLKASAASKCEQLAAIFAAIAEQIEASDMEDFLDECQEKADELKITLEYYLEEFI